MIPLPVIQQYVSNVVGTPVVLSCEADATFDPTADGLTFFGTSGHLLNVLHLRQSLCNAAQAADRKQQRYNVAFLTFQGQRADLETGSALEVILHEAMHVALDSVNESVVECAAISNIWPLVRQFRLPAWIASAVMAGAAWRHAAFPAAYHSTGAC